MNKILAAALLLALAGNGYLGWYLYSRIEPSTAQLDADLLALKVQRSAIAGREVQGSQAEVLDTILAQTQAMLEQKRSASLRFVDVHYLADGRPIASSAADLAQVEIALAEQEKLLGKAREDLEQYSGGLIRTVISLRVEVTELSVALLKQRKVLLANGVAPPAAKATSTAPPTETLLELEEEIKRKAVEIETTEAEARRYSGGLLQVTLLMRAETEKMTLAMLEQRRLVLKYQIGLPTVGAPASERGAQPKAPGKVVGDKEALQ